MQRAGSVAAGGTSKLAAPAGIVKEAEQRIKEGICRTVFFASRRAECAFRPGRFPPGKTSRRARCVPSSLQSGLRRSRPNRSHDTPDGIWNDTSGTAG